MTPVPLSGTAKGRGSQLASRDRAIEQDVFPADIGPV